MFELRLINLEERSITCTDIETLDPGPEPSAELIWIDIAGRLSTEDIRTLQHRFGLHPLALQDAARDRHPPKFERFETHSFLIFKELTADSDSIDCGTIQLAIFASDRFLITRHSGESASVARLAEELESGKASLFRGPGAMAARLCRLLVQRYLRVLLGLEPRLEELEKSVLTTGDDTVLAELIGYKAALTRLRRFLHYHVEVVSDLHHDDNPGFGGELQHEINDVYEQQERAASLADLFYQQSSDLIDGYISVSSHRLNQIMRVLTIITAVFVPLSFLAGIYGMNFDNMPELNSRWGYFTLLGVMATVATTLLLTFRRKGWL